LASQGTRKDYVRKAEANALKAGTTKTEDIECHLHKIHSHRELTFQDSLSQRISTACREAEKGQEETGSAPIMRRTVCFLTCFSNSFTEI
jgi:hypothetical protein